MTDTTKGSCSDGNCSISHLLHNMHFSLCDAGCRFCHTNTNVIQPRRIFRVEVGFCCSERKINTTDSRYNVNIALADSVVVATDYQWFVLQVDIRGVDDTFAEFLLSEYEKGLSNWHFIP